MIDGTDKGKYTYHASDLPNELAWERFYPLRGKLSSRDILRELFDWGLDGNMYVTLIRVPEEYPAAEDEEFVDLYEPEDAIKILTGWNGCKETLRMLADMAGYKVIDEEGNEI